MLYLIKAFDWDNTVLWTIIFWWFIRLLLNSAFTIQKTPSSLFSVLHSENSFSENWNYLPKLHGLWGPRFSVLGNRKLFSNTGIKQALGLSNAFSRKSYICRRNQRLMLGFDLKAPSLNWLPIKLVVSISPHWDRMNHVHKRRQRVQFPIMHRSWKIHFPVKNAMNKCHKTSY